MHIMDAYMPQQLQLPQRPQPLAFPEASFSPMDWGFDEEDSRGGGAFSPDLCATSAQLLAPCTAGGDASAAQSDPVDGIPLRHSSPHHSPFPQVLSPPIPLEQYLRDPDLVPSYYRPGPSQAPQVPHHQVIQQFDDELARIYPGPPVSRYDSPVKLDQEDFPEPQRPVPAYLPPESFLLSPLPIHENPFPTEVPINPHPTPAETIIKLEDSGFCGRDEKGPFSLPSLPTPESIFVPPARATNVCCMPYGGGDGTCCKQAQSGQSGPVHSPAVPEDSPPDELADDIDCDKMAPYAVLIYRALMSTPNRKMVLSQIYEYFREKIPRFRKVKGRGWMNSIRHNLSMNGAFLKEDRPPEDPGKGFIWVLSEEAAREGVKSTTRYRKSPPSSKKRAAEDFYPHSIGVKRRRKSPRKWVTAKSCSRPRSGSLAALAESPRNEIELQLPSTSTDSSPCPDDLPSPQTPVHIPALVKHLGPPMDNGSFFSADKILPPFDTSRCPHGLDYASCYESLAQAANLRAAYNSEGEALPFLCDENWHICEISDRFSEEFTLVTEERRRI